MNTDILTIDLTKVQFEKIRKMLYNLCGINLTKGKEQLVKARLSKRLRAMQLINFDQYFEYLEKDRSGQELTCMIDALATNKTDFFRENKHFEFLRRNILPVISNKPMRFWSAGCSSGEEPYTLSLVLREEIPNIDQRDVRILATDISTKTLKIAQKAIYSHEVLEDVPGQLISKYFTCVQRESPRLYRVNDNIRSLVSFARLNLMETWPMKGPFDVIFCRNVMIYFDTVTREKLIQRFRKLLGPGGFLFVGHSESLAALSHDLKYVQPAVYLKQ